MDRISLAQMFTQGLRGMLGAQVAVSKTQAQMSSGLRVTTPSDDPAAAAQILQLDQTQVNIEQFKKNITGATNSLELEDTTLESIGNLLTRARELAVQAGDGGLSQTDRQGITSELAARLGELAGIANTRNSNGEYIFSGFQGQQVPFAQTSAGGYTYQGDAGQRSVQISSSTYVAVNDSGKDIFVGVNSTRLPTSATASNAGDGTIAMGQVIDQTQFKTNFNGPYTITITTGATPTYQIDTVPAGAAVATGNYISGQAIQFNGAEIDIVGAPGNGDTFTVGAPATQDVFTTINKLVQGLQSYTDSADDKLRLKDLISESLDNFDSAQTNISTIQAKVGARLNILDSTSDLQNGTGLINQKVLADVRDLDYASAVSQLTQQNLVLQAAQQSFAKITSLSLFDFLR